MHIPERLTMRTGGILKIIEETQLPTSLRKNQYLSSPFHPRILEHKDMFQIDFPMLKNKNQSTLSLLKTTKQKENYL